MRTFNKTAILWTKKDIDVLFQNAQGAIKDSIEETWNVLDIRSAVSDLDILSGVLEMLQLHTATALIKAIREAVVRISLTKGSSLSQESSGADVHLLNDEEMLRLQQGVVQGLIQFPDLMEYLSEGHKDIPELVLPLVNEIKDVLKEKRVQPSSLFAPDTFVDMAFLESNPEYQDPEIYKKRCEYMSSLFQGSLMQWVKGDENPFALESFINICEQMTQNALNNDVRKVFFVAQKCFEAFHHESLPCSMHWKHALAKLDKVIKSSGVHGHSLPLEEQLFVQELLHQLLYFVAFEGHNSGILEEVVMLFGLDDFMYSEEDLALAKSMLAGRNQQLMNIVSSGLKEEIMAVKDGLDMYLRTGDVAQLSNQVDRLENIHLTLGMLGLDEESSCALAQKSALGETVLLVQSSAPSALVQERLTQIASEVLGIDAAISNKVADVHHDNTATAQKLHETLIAETMVNLSKAKHGIIRYSETKDHSHLQDLPKWLEGSSSALLMMSDATGHEYFEKLYELVEEVVTTTRSLSDDDILALANVIVCLDYYLEATRDHQPDPYRILEVARQNFLHFGKKWDPLSTIDMDVSFASVATGEDLTTSSTPLGHAGFLEQDAKPANSSLPSTVFVATEEVPPPPPVAQFVPRRGRKIDPFDGKTDQSMIDDEIKDIFAEEMQEEIDSLKGWVPSLSTKYDRDIAFNVRKSFHTIKGSGRMIGAKSLGEIAWRGESVLNKVLEGQRPYSAQVHQMVLKGLELFEQFVLSTSQTKDVYWEDEAFLNWSDALMQGKEVSFDEFSKAHDPEKIPDHAYSSSAPVANVVSLEQSAHKKGAPPSEMPQTVLPSSFSGLSLSDSLSDSSGVASVQHSSLAPPLPASEEGDRSAHLDEVRWEGLDLDLNREFSLDSSVVDKTMEEEHGWNLDALSLLPEELDPISSDEQQSERQPLFENLELSSMTSDDPRSNDQIVFDTPSPTENQDPSVFVPSDEAVASDDFSTQGPAATMHTPEPRPTFDFSNLSLELVDNDAPIGVPTPPAVSSPSGVQQDDQKDQIALPSQTLEPAGLSLSDSSLALDLPEEASLPPLLDFEKNDLEKESFEIKEDLALDLSGFDVALDSSLTLSDASQDGLSLDIGSDLSVETLSSSSPSALELASSDFGLQEIQSEDLTVQVAPQEALSFNSSEGLDGALNDAVPASSGLALSVEESVVGSSKDEVFVPASTPSPSPTAQPAPSTPSVVLSALPALSALPVTKPSKEDWKEYASILVENNQTLKLWLDQIEESGAYQNNQPLRDFADHLMGLQKRNVHLMNKLMGQVMDVESNLIKQEMKEMLKTTSSAPSAPKPSAPSSPPASPAQSPSGVAQSVPPQQPAAQATPPRPTPPKPAFKSTPPAPQKPQSFWSRLFKKK